jgi:hypothetical protein
LARYGNVWHPQELQSHLRLFPEGQFSAELNAEVVASVQTISVTVSDSKKPSAATITFCLNTL